MDSYSNVPKDSVNAPELAQSARRRTQRLIDPSWQLGIACAVTMSLLGTGALYMLMSAVMESSRLAAALGPQGLQWMGLGADIVFFLSVAAVVHHVIVRMTHSVVGPAFAIERVLRGMTEGNFMARLPLRSGDYLTNVASATRDLNEHLGAQADQVQGIIEQLQSSADSELEVLAAADRLGELFGIDMRPTDDEAAQVPVSDERMAA